MKDLKVLAGILMAGVLFGFAGCKTETDSTVAVEKVEITSTVTSVVEDSTISLTAKVSPENATNKTVTWTSSAEDVATVDKKGVVTGVKAGKATITAKVGEKTVTVDITVIKLVAGVKITSTESEVAEGGSITLTAEVNPVDATDPKITWTSDNEEVATVDASTGVVKGLKSGSATITAKAGEKSATVEIKVIIPVSGVKITSTEKEVTVGSPITFKATVSPDNATYNTVTWSSSAEDVATVDSNGLVTGLKAGKTTITAKAGEQTDSVEITVIIAVSDVKITSTETEVALNSSIALKAEVTPSDATDPTVTWSSSDTTVATVDASTGVVTGVKVGKATITAKAGEKSATVEITVIIPEFTSFKIPNAGISKKGNTVTATVIGKNFTAQGITSDSFSLSCISNSDILKDSKITISNDTRLTVTLIIPENAGSYDVTIASGNISLTSTFTVKDYSSYVVGDVILKDGSKVDVTSVSSVTFETSGDKVPVAIVAGFNTNGVVLGLGLKKSDALRWAKSGTTGDTTRFTDIIARRIGSLSKEYTITGDCDGSDNWEYICSIDKDGTDTVAEIAENYPAFDFAVNYGTATCKFDANSELVTGWYIPSIYELYEVYKNKITLQTSLDKVKGFEINEIVSYWSSSMMLKYNTDAYFLDPTEGIISRDSKSHTNYVLVVRAF